MQRRIALPLFAAALCGWAFACGDTGTDVPPGSSAGPGTFVGGSGGTHGNPFAAGHAGNAGAGASAGTTGAAGSAFGQGGGSAGTTSAFGGMAAAGTGTAGFPSSAGSTGTAGTTGGAGGPSGDPLADARKLCVDTINMYRATLQLAPYVEWSDAEMCVDQEAQTDAMMNMPHYAFTHGMTCGGNAQNECPNWGTDPSGIPGCLDLMWHEKDRPQCTGCDTCDVPYDNCQNCTFFGTNGTDGCGHYLNMKSAIFTGVACGFYLQGSGYWAQNFHLRFRGDDRMIQLRTETLVAMRDRLRDRGAPASVARPGATLDDALSSMIHEEYGPLCEAMYLMMRADGDVGQDERDVLRGALRELDERIRTAHVERMIASADEALEGSSVEARLRSLAGSFRKDEVRGEVAFVLAAAIAFADDRIAPEETSLLEDFADALGIDEARSEELLRSLVR